VFDRESDATFSHFCHLVLHLCQLLVDGNVPVGEQSVLDKYQSIFSELLRVRRVNLLLQDVWADLALDLPDDGTPQTLSAQPHRL
jgi:hypothetical protein